MKSRAPFILLALLAAVFSISPLRATITTSPGGGGGGTNIFNVNSNAIATNNGTSWGQTLEAPTNMVTASVWLGSSNVTFQSSNPGSPIANEAAVSNAVQYAILQTGRSPVIYASAGVYDLLNQNLVSSTVSFSLLGAGRGVTWFFDSADTNTTGFHDIPFLLRGGLQEMGNFSCSNGLYISPGPNNLAVPGKCWVHDMDFYANGPGGGIDCIFMSTVKLMTNDFVNLGLHSGFDSFNLNDNSAGTFNAQVDLTFQNVWFDAVATTNSIDTVSGGVTIRGFAVTSGSNSIFRINDSRINAVAFTLTNGASPVVCDGISLGSSVAGTPQSGNQIYLHATTITTSATNGVTPYDIAFRTVTNVTVYVDPTDIWNPSKTLFTGFSNRIVCLNSYGISTNVLLDGVWKGTETIPNLTTYLAAIPTNTAQLVYFTNFTPAAATSFTNITAGKITLRCPIAFSAGASSGTGSNFATCAFNVNTNGGLAYSDSPFVYSLGVTTNGGGQTWQCDLGPGDFIQFQSSTSGNGSHANFGTATGYVK